MAASRLGVLAAAAARRRDGGGELPRAERGVRPAGAVAARHRARHGGEWRSNILTFRGGTIPEITMRYVSRYLSHDTIRITILH